jgi:hypothetical protein
MQSSKLEVGDSMWHDFRQVGKSLILRSEPFLSRLAAGQARTLAANWNAGQAYEW